MGRARWDNEFFKLGSALKKTGAQLKNHLGMSGLSSGELFAIWNLSDIDKDGALDADEFAVCMHLIECKTKAGMSIPENLPQALVPPSKRGMAL